MRPDLVPEMELLRRCTRHGLAGSPPDDDLAPLLTRVNWHHVLWLGRQQGALLFLHKRLKAGPLRELGPVEVIAQLEALRQVNQLRSLARARELCLMQDLFDRNGISALVPDRWLLAHSSGVSPELVMLGTSLRYLVPEEQRARALAVLHEAGRPTESDPQQLIKTNDGPVLLIANFAGAAGAGRIWSAARRMVVGGRSLGGLSPVHWLFQRAGRRQRTLTLLEAWEMVVLVGQISDEEWRQVPAEAAELGLDSSWAEAVARSFDMVGVPRPAALAGISLSSAPTAGPEAVDRAPFLPTAPVVVQHMLQLAGTAPSDVVYDVGCGDGRLVIEAAKKFGARGVGVDLDPVRIASATANAFKHGVGEQVSFIAGDLFAQDLSGATVLGLYLLPGFFPRLREKLVREAKPGLRIVSHDYIFPGWPPEKTEIIRTNLRKISQIYLWRMG